MTVLEAVLIIIGILCIVASFFVTEKLSDRELGMIGDASREEIQILLRSQLERASDTIDRQMEEALEPSFEAAKRSMEKECNEKIMAISEYSDTVLESMNKTHNEIMFLYSMLGDKHKELTKLSGELQQLNRELTDTGASLKGQQQGMTDADLLTSFEEAVTKMETQGEGTEQRMETEDGAAGVLNHNEEILELLKKGMNEVEIAKELDLGLGEVKLVKGLYKGDR